MTGEQLKIIIAGIAALQEENGTDSLPCPRCGEMNMNHVSVRNALSRRAHIYICSDCGMDEALHDMSKVADIDIADWVFMGMFEMKEQF